ncbi:MAG TPA: ATP-binding cassette domain-containing protein [Candidatus Pacearchaeota archaeon]|jgi:polar amino acid transport system ATP-binding protein|nr:ATP-binding cassette domain-containing protein [Candidatus Pacearchaeota archaeon]|tara:strand:- start:44 stop:751 length:708 start_codon:yes stop_codon:yes gene_type:complete
MIKVNNLTKRYSNFKNSEEGVIDASFKVKKGEVVAVIGPSGSGKSTLLKILAGLKKQDCGSYSFREETKIGYVSQEYTLWPHLNVLENLTLAPELKNPTNKTAIKKEAIKLLKKFELEKYIETYPHELSGGQKQRVALIRSLMIKPDILLLDEVTSSLDPELTKSVLDLIHELADEGYTMLVVTHHVSFAKSIADKVLFLKKGRILDYKDAKNFFENQKNSEIKSFIADILHKYA